MPEIICVQTAKDIISCLIITDSVLQNLGYLEGLSGMMFHDSREFGEVLKKSTAGLWEGVFGGDTPEL